MIYRREEEGNDSADDDSSVENVPQISTVRARMKYHAEVDDLIHTVT